MIHLSVLFSRHLWGPDVFVYFVYNVYGARHSNSPFQITILLVTFFFMNTTYRNNSDL